LRGYTQHAIRLALQLPVTSHLTSGTFNDAEANFIGGVRQRTLIGGVTKSCWVNWVNFEFIRTITVKKNELEGSCGREERRGEVNLG
jgi:hypothetical protein